MYKDYRYINAGTNEIYRWGHKTQDKVSACLIPNENGYYSIPADGGKYWTIGTSDGQYGEYAKFKGEFLNVNKGGYVYAKVGTPKAEIFVAMLNDMLKKMNSLLNGEDEEETEEE